MTEPLRKYQSSDVPDFASYPAEPERMTGAIVGVVEISEFEAIPEATRTNSYDEQGRKIGASLGRLVNKIAEYTAPIRAEVRAQVERAEDDVELAKNAAERTYKTVSRKLAFAARQGIVDSRAKAALVQRKAAQTVNDYPVETLAAVGVAGILVGAGLRAWRENRG